MSEFTTLALMVAIVMPDLYLYMLLDRVRKERENEIVTGVIHGVAVSTSYRWILLYTSWLTPASFLIGIRVIMTPVYLTMPGALAPRG